MKFSQVLFAAMIGLAVSSCGNAFKGETKSVAPAPKKTLEVSLTSLSSKSDPVCGMALKQGEIADTAAYEGKVFGFCGTGCKDEFVKSPKQYLTQQ